MTVSDVAEPADGQDRLAVPGDIVTVAGEPKRFKLLGVETTQAGMRRAWTLTDDCQFRSFDPDQLTVDLEATEVEADRVAQFTRKGALAPGYARQANVVAVTDAAPNIPVAIDPPPLPI